MYTRSEVAAICLIITAWGGAILLFTILIYARAKYGVGKSRTIGAILIDIGMMFAGLVLVLGLLPFVRIFGQIDGEPWNTVIRFGNILAFWFVIWFAVARLLYFFLVGDGPFFWPWQGESEEA